jgi:O-antigen ligase
MQGHQQPNSQTAAGFPPGPSTAYTDFLKIVVLLGLTTFVLMVSILNAHWGLYALAVLLGSAVFSMNLRWGLVGLIFLVPFDPQIEIRPGVFVYFDLLFVLPALAYAWKVLFGNLRVNWVSFLFVPFVLFALATGYWRPENLYFFLGYGARLTIAVLLIATVAVVGRSETITRMLGLTLFPQVIYGLYQIILGERGSLYSAVYPHYADYGWTDRARAFFFTENNFGSYCATILVMVLALALRSESRALSLFYYITACFGLVGVASSGSRGAWLGAITGLLVLFFLDRKRLNIRFGLAAALVAVAVVSVASTLMQYEPLQRSTTLDTFTVDTRSSLYLGAFLLFLQHPFIGIGLTNFSYLTSSVVDWDYTPAAAHNTYLQVLAENGIVGFILFFAPIVYLFYKNLKKAKESTVALVASSGMTVFLVHGLFDFQLMTGPQYLLLVAILFGLASRVIWGPDEFSSVTP